MVDVLRFIFETPGHFLGTCVLLLLIMPWNWTRRKEHIIKFGDTVPGVKKKKPEKEHLHIDAP